MTQSLEVLAQRDLRQRAIVPPQALAQCRASVIGVGAIGRQVALQLAAMGISWLQLVDFDTVEPVNLACQGYLEADLGQLKVQATAELARQINSQMELVLVAERYRRSLTVGQVVFLCVDSIQSRQCIWEALQHKVAFLADGRMSAEVIRVLAVCDDATRRHYPATLFDPREAQGGSCTAKSTIFTASIAAGLMLQQFSRYLRGLPVEADLCVNLLAGEMSVGAV